MMTDLASFYICYSDKCLTNFYTSRLKKYCTILEIFKFFQRHYDPNKRIFCDFLWHLYLNKNTSVYLEIFTVDTSHVELLPIKKWARINVSSLRYECTEKNGTISNQKRYRGLKKGFVHRTEPKKVLNSLQISEPF